MKTPILYLITRPLIKLFTKLYRVEIKGKENIPSCGRIVLAGNHTHNFDCLILIASTTRCIRFLAKDELIKGPFGFIFKLMGIIPVNRRTKDAGALKNAIDVLNNDGVIGIFPEGTTNETEETILKFKKGAVKMSDVTNSNIVPFVIRGKFRLFRKGLSIEFLKPYTLKSHDIVAENQKLMNIIKSNLEGEPHEY